jgi:hypothetical protein
MIDRRPFSDSIKQNQLNECQGYHHKKCARDQNESTNLSSAVSVVRAVPDLNCSIIDHQRKLIERFGDTPRGSAWVRFLLRRWWPSTRGVMCM